MTYLGSEVERWCWGGCDLLWRGGAIWGHLLRLVAPSLSTGWYEVHVRVVSAVLGLQAWQVSRRGNAPHGRHFTQALHAMFLNHGFLSGFNRLALQGKIST